ncbi:MAG: diacylglycerol kinase [Planctomycetaceae bacterium]|nr:diacylglycerol kinase [Planctomycetales bacterium]MCB9923246.1 diacylglycerol kinase [Planctomycetaceae bacterium]
MPDVFQPPPHSFLNKFRCALRGLVIGSRNQSSIGVHLLVTTLVIGVAGWLNVTPNQWCLLVLCIAIVLTLELFNSAIESLAKAVDRQHNERLRDALDIASGAVLIGAVGAAIVGLLVLLPRLIQVVNELN